MVRAIDAGEAKAAVHGAGEIAFLDVREHGQYGEGHPFLAISCPFSRLETSVGTLVPRLGVPVLLLDDGDGIAERAGAALKKMGYRDVTCLGGGAPAWAKAGFTLFEGVNLPSKTLGELLEERWHVPRIDVETLAAWQVGREEFVLIDGRPTAEFAKSTLPGARSVPNGELPHRFERTVPNDRTPIVIHCAGRTRSITGAAGLALSGVTNPIFALENGTQGWALSGRALWRDAIPEPLPELSEADRQKSVARGDAILGRYGVAEIHAEQLRRLASDPQRTLFVLDVRSQQEFGSGTIPGAVHAPAVQLVQATDQCIGVRRARVVLCDDTGLRAAVTAVFLQMLGHEVFVLRNVERVSAGFERIDAPKAACVPVLAECAPKDVAQILAGGGMVLDLRPSMEFRAGHVEGARWAIRPRLPDRGDAAPAVLVGPPDETALAAKDLAATGLPMAGRLGGGPQEWRAAGLSVVASPNDPPDQKAIDFLFFVHDRHEGNMAAARRYLAWETGLTGRLDAAERAEYRIGPSPFA